MAEFGTLAKAQAGRAPDWRSVDKKNSLDQIGFGD